MEAIDLGTSPGYKWKPLNLRKNEFRILKLHDIVQEEEGEVLRVSVLNVSMSGHPPYNALSYTWGDRSHQRKILLEGSPHWITKNLHEALCVLFNRGIRNIWADALCIDQYDLEEKSLQVARMATIFQEAETVDVWLGPAPSESATLIEFMRNVDPSILEQQFWAQSLIPRASDKWEDFNQDFLDFLECPYWTRLWVAQEIAMANDIRVNWGSQDLAGSVFELLFSYEVWEKIEPRARVSWRWWHYRLFGHMVHLWGLRAKRRSRQPIDLLSLMYQLRTSKTTELVDRVYAVSGLAFDHRTYIAEPDYNLQPEQLCLDMTRRFIKSTGSLDIVLLSTFNTKFPKSWVPPLLDLDTGSLSHVQFYINYLSGKSQRSLCGTPGMFWQTTNSGHANAPRARLENGAMKVLGLRLGTVSESLDGSSRLEGCSGDSGGSSPATSRERELEIFDSLCRLLLIHSPFYNSNNLLQELAVRLLYDIQVEEIKRNGYFDFGIFKLSAQETNSLCMRTLFKGPVERMLRRGIATTESKAGVPPPNRLSDGMIKEAMEAARTVLADFNIAVLVGSKHLALVLDGALVWLQMEFWLLAGLSWPVVLDPLGLGYAVRSFGLVDSVDVRGKMCRVMDGEAWRTATEDDLEWVTLV